MHTYVNCGTVYNSKDLEPTQMPINDTLDQENRLLVRLIKKKREKIQIDAIKTIKGISPLIPQKYKLPSEITTNNSMHINQ